ncbi:MAG: hypothetical protein KDB14_21970 [Planctomycetales bacterium]|nr:hypothetical protein [Planctomycetales bacterium]
MSDNPYQSPQESSAHPLAWSVIEPSRHAVAPWRRFVLWMMPAATAHMAMFQAMHWIERPPLIWLQPVFNLTALVVGVIAAWLFGLRLLLLASEFARRWLLASIAPDAWQETFERHLLRLPAFGPVMAMLWILGAAEFELLHQHYTYMPVAMHAVAAIWWAPLLRDWWRLRG